VVLCDDQDRVLEETARCIGEATNNQAEYRAMLAALETAKKHRAKRVICYGDSELIIFQLQGVYRIKDLTLKSLAEKVKSVAAGFESVTFRQVPREHPLISRADRLLNQALDRARVQASIRQPKAPEPGQQELL
jgi:ribonuclease HI